MEWSCEGIVEFDNIEFSYLIRLRLQLKGKSKACKILKQTEEK